MLEPKYLLALDWGSHSDIQARMKMWQWLCMEMEPVIKANCLKLPILPNYGNCQSSTYVRTTFMEWELAMPEVVAMWTTIREETTFQE